MIFFLQPTLFLYHLFFRVIVQLNAVCAKIRRTEKRRKYVFEFETFCRLDLKLERNLMLWYQEHIVYFIYLNFVILAILQNAFHAGKISLDVTDPNCKQTSNVFFNQSFSVETHVYRKNWPFPWIKNHVLQSRSL